VALPWTSEQPCGVDIEAMIERGMPVAPPPAEVIDDVGRAVARLPDESVHDRSFAREPVCSWSTS
jgi:hypothetical protein